MEKLKLEIKNWEHDFFSKNGRNPSKSDIKANLEIASKYKQYKDLKVFKPQTSLRTPTKQNRHSQAYQGHKEKPREQRQLVTPQKTSPLSSSPPIAAQELGPTPQLNGRVLSIFDIVNSPSVTPSKVKLEFDDDIQMSDYEKTPTKKLDFSRIMECYGDEEEHIRITDNEEEQNEEEKHYIQVPSSQTIFKTPQKNGVVNFIKETPAYLRTNSMSISSEIGASPSPLNSLRLQKSLSTLMDEYKDIQDELKYGDFDKDELVPIIEVKEEEGTGDASEIESDSSNVKLWKKKRTQKRQTRRTRMKARKVVEVDEMKDKNVHEVIKEIEESKVKGVIIDSSDESESGDESEEEYVRQPLQPLDPNKMKERKNFVRLKINKKKKFFGRRGRF